MGTHTFQRRCHDLANFVLISYRHCSKLGRVVLNTYISTGLHWTPLRATWTSTLVCACSELEFSSCDMNEAFVPELWGELAERLARSMCMARHASSVSSRHKTTVRLWTVHVDDTPAAIVLQLRAAQTIAARMINVKQCVRLLSVHYIHQSTPRKRNTVSQEKYH